MSVATAQATIAPSLGQRHHKQTLYKGQSESQGPDQACTVECIEGLGWMVPSSVVIYVYVCKGLFTEQSTWGTDTPGIPFVLIM